MHGPFTCNRSKKFYIKKKTVKGEREKGTESQHIRRHCLMKKVLSIVNKVVHDYSPSWFLWPALFYCINVINNIICLTAFCQFLSDAPLHTLGGTMSTSPWIFSSNAQHETKNTWGMRVLCAFLNTETPWCEDWKIFSVGVPAWGLWSVGGNRAEVFSPMELGDR